MTESLLAWGRATWPCSSGSSLWSTTSFAFSYGGTWAREGPGQHPLEATALVNEAVLRLFDVNRVQGETARTSSRCGAAMRRVLVDHVRARGNKKRGGRDKGLAGRGARGFHERGQDLVALDAVLADLSRWSHPET